MLDELNLVPVRLGSGPIWSWLIDRLGWVDLINRHVSVSPDDCRLSHGLRAKALLVNILTDRRALYKVQEFYEESDIAVLLGDDVSPDALNDDALGRTLEALYRTGIDAILTDAAFSALEFAKVPLNCLHADTTSMSFYGQYREGYALKITRGYSKDHRPDLKQVVFGIVTAGGIPVVARPENGNLDDKTWNAATIGRLVERLPADKLEEVLYVADSAAVTAKNLRLFKEHRVRFVSRLPGTFAECEKVKCSALERSDAWEEVGRLSERKDGATYRVQSFHRELNGTRYRFIAVQSSTLDARKEQRLQAELAREFEIYTAAARNEEKRTYSCLEDARRAAAELVESLRGYHTIQVETVEEVQTLKRPTRGRPRKDAPPPQTCTVCRNRVSVHKPSPEAMEEARRTASMFVLITNVLDEQRLSNVDVLRIYKEQHEVEGRFRFLKSPYFVGPVYLQNNDRIEAFGCLMLLAMILYATFEFVIRAKMAEETEPLILPGKRKSWRPTGVSVLEMFDGFDIVHICINGELIRKVPSQRNPQLDRILRMLGTDIQVYSEVRKTA
ncbi:MAG: IS1634 family transposase [Alicyclobacillus sp.]|nr:IS1634 family transposase [Alicyclobacillus sp.]